MNRKQQLEQQLKELNREQNNCNHKWKKPYKKEVTEKEHYDTGEYHTFGVHQDAIWAYRDKTVTKWARECKKCGKEELTTKMKKKVIETEPDF